MSKFLHKKNEKILHFYAKRETFRKKSLSNRLSLTVFSCVFYLTRTRWVVRLADSEVSSGWRTRR